MTIFSGKNSISQLNKLLKNFGSKKGFLVTGKGFYEKCGAKAYIESISSEISFIIFSDFEENPKLEDVRKGINILRNNSCDLILAIGGGSYIDMAKLINALYQMEDDLLERNIKENKIKTPLLPFIAIPTTAGSGSEATHFAVVYIDEKKYSLADQYLLPDHVILDHELLRSQPKYQMAVSGIDAISQAIESLWSINSTKESIKYSIQAIELLWFNLPEVLENPNDNNLSKVMKGAHLAGKAINIAKTTAPHALAYGFTTYCKLPHGHAVALSLPFFINHHLKVNSQNCLDPRGYLYVREKLKTVGDILGIPSNKIPFRFSEFINKCGLEINFLKLNINKKLFNEITSMVNIERLKNNPVKTNELDLLKLYEFNLSLHD